MPLAIVTIASSAFFLSACDNNDDVSETVNAVQSVSNVQSYEEQTRVKLLQINSANNIELLINDKPTSIVNPYIEVPHVDLKGYEDHPLGEKTLDYVQQLIRSAKFLTIDYSHDEQYSEGGERYGFIKVEHTDLGELLLKQGLAKVVHRSYDDELYQRYKEIEEESKDEEKGIWVFPNTFNEEGFIQTPISPTHQTKSHDNNVQNQQEKMKDIISPSTPPRGEYKSQIFKE